MKITGRTKICTIIGDPVAHSLSPILHNAGYEALGIDDQFVFTATPVSKENLAAALDGIRALGIWGISCTMPHKEAVIPLLDHLDGAADKIGAVNTIVNKDGALTGFNTDWIGITRPLSRILGLRGINVAVIGAGGTARAAIYGLMESGANVTIFNRTVERAIDLAKRFSCCATRLDDPVLARCEVVINATAADSPIDVRKRVSECKVALDVNYRHGESSFIRDARSLGAQVVNGEEVFIEQGLAQFEIYTGHKAPSGEMVKAIDRRQNV